MTYTEWLYKPYNTKLYWTPLSCHSCCLSGRQCGYLALRCVLHVWTVLSIKVKCCQTIISEWHCNTWCSTQCDSRRQFDMCVINETWHALLLIFEKKTFGRNPMAICCMVADFVFGKTCISVHISMSFKGFQKYASPRPRATPLNPFLKLLSLPSYRTI